MKRTVPEDLNIKFLITVTPKSQEANTMNPMISPSLLPGDK